MRAERGYGSMETKKASGAWASWRLLVGDEIVVVGLSGCVLAICALL